MQQFSHSFSLTRLSNLDIETKGYKNVKDSRDEMHETHSTAGHSSLDHRRNEDTLR